jgi:hypothetical protein
MLQHVLLAIFYRKRDPYYKHRLAAYLYALTEFSSRTVSAEERLIGSTAMWISVHAPEAVFAVTM